MQAVGVQPLQRLRTDRDVVRLVIDRLLMRIPPEEKVRIHISTIRDCVKVLKKGEWEDSIDGCLRVKAALQKLNLYNPIVSGKGVYILLSRNFLNGRSRCLACQEEIPNFEISQHRSKCWVAYVCNACKKECGTRDLALKHRTETTHNDYRPKTDACPDCAEIFPIYHLGEKIFLQYHDDPVTIEETQDVTIETIDENLKREYTQ